MRVDPGAVGERPPTRMRGAGEGIRTLDIQLGRLSLYQLSYSRVRWLRTVPMIPRWRIERVTRTVELVAAQAGWHSADQGARTVERLEQNLDAVGWSLSPEAVMRLDEVSALDLPSPYDFIDRYTRRRDENAVYASGGPSHPKQYRTT